MKKAFVSVLPSTDASISFKGYRYPPDVITVHVRLPNGVEFDLGEASLEELTTIVQMLGRLPCSGSTKG
ncbi:hypothetical protein ACPUER_35950 [Burkholderia sp. DN3021]|uniref:hypothetical protein n=1 Tax=Burkholderia sp. DN3021 TaxID=3410137 RepID=UPI003C7A051B